MAQKLLLLDDDSEIAYQRVLILGIHGFQVDTAASIVEADQKRRNGRYDLILVDLRQDPDSAAAWCEEVKEEDPSQLYAILAPVYAHVPADCADDVIHKDGPAQLVERVKRLMETSATEASAN